MALPESGAFGTFAAATSANDVSSVAPDANPPVAPTAPTIQPLSPSTIVPASSQVGSDVYLHSPPMGASMEGMKGMDHDMGAMKMDAPKTAASGPDVIFHTNFPRAGLYKVWGQFKHKGKIVIAPFVVNVGEGTGEAPPNDADEAKPHSH